MQYTELDKDLLEQYALRKAAQHSLGLERRCRRWRRLAAVRRVAALALLLVVSAAVADAFVARHLWAHGALSAQQCSLCVTQMLVQA